MIEAEDVDAPSNYLIPELPIKSFIQREIAHHRLSIRDLVTHSKHDPHAFEVALQVFPRRPISDKRQANI